MRVVRCPRARCISKFVMPYSPKIYRKGSGVIKIHLLVKYIALEYRYIGRESRKIAQSEECFNPKIPIRFFCHNFEKRDDFPIRLNRPITMEGWGEKGGGGIFFIRCSFISSFQNCQVFESVIITF